MRSRRCWARWGSRPRWATKAASRRCSRRTRRRSTSSCRRFESAGYEPGRDVAIALDVAASELYQDGEYVFKKGDGSRRSRRGDGGPVCRLGGPLSDRLASRTAWPRTTGRAGRCSPSGCTSGCSSSGDDLFVTNVDRLGRGIEEGVANAVLVKVNQIGTLTETLQCIELAKGSAYGVDHLAPLGRDRGHLHRRSRGGDRRGPDQDRQRQPHRSHRQVQPAAPDRRRAGRSGALPRPGPLPAVTAGALGRAGGAGASRSTSRIQGGEYGTTDLLALRAAGGERAGPGAPPQTGGRFPARATPPRSSTTPGCRSGSPGSGSG